MLWHCPYVPMRDHRGSGVKSEKKYHPKIRNCSVSARPGRSAPRYPKVKPHSEPETHAFKRQRPPNTDGDQRKPHSPRVLSSAPLFLLGAESRRGTLTSEKGRRRDASTRRGVCSVSTVTTEAGKGIVHRSERRSLFASNFLASKAERFSNKTKSKCQWRTQGKLARRTQNGK
jgi:hypothetical protein